MNENNKKMENAGNPLLLIFIFVMIMAFLFFIPEFYEKYNSEKAALYGIGENSKKKKTTEEQNIPQESEYFGIGGNTTFDNISFSNANITNNILSIDAKNKLTTPKYLNSEDYYVEFYKSADEKTFLGRRILTSDEPIDDQKESLLQIDINGITTDENTVMRIIYLTSNNMPEVQLENNTLTCVKGNETYTYEFDGELKLKKLDYKITNNLDENTLNSYKQFKEQLDNLNGTTTNITETDTNFTFNTVLDYNISKVFRINLDHIYNSSTLSKTIKFKNEAKGFDCQ